MNLQTPTPFAKTRHAMLHTFIALTPALLLMAWTFGYGFVFNLLLACSAAVVVEASILKTRGLPVARLIGDGSALLTGALIALALPPYLSWWIPVFAAAAGIAIGKHLYGGLGNNLFNPAMLGYCIALVAWPLHLTSWPETTALSADLMQALSYLGSSDAERLADALTGATPLEALRFANTPIEVAAIPWAELNIAFAIGGAWLLLQGIISWHIPVGVLVTLAILAALDPSTGAFSSQHLVTHLLSGSTMIGAFFIATDPATSPNRPAAMLLFGAGVGLLLMLIRYNGVYADGLAFAVLIMNATVPLLDRLFETLHDRTKSI